MSDIATYEAVKDKIIAVRDQQVIIDSDVADLYGVATKRINEAVKNNPEKFPGTYILELDRDEWEEVRSKFSTSPKGGGKVRPPRAFTEKGLYMLATILKSAKATETTINIIDTFAKVREAGRILNQLPEITEQNPEQQNMLHKAGEIVSSLVVPEHLATDQTEACIELNLAMVKFKYSVKKKPR